MRTQAQARARAGPPAPTPDRTFGALARTHLPGVLIVAAAGGAVVAFFLALYVVRHYTMPIGWDTPRYLDQTNLVAAHGLAGVPTELPPPIKTLPSRGAFPISLLTLSSLFQVSTFSMATVIPPAAAAAVALAAGALVSWTFRRGAWTLAAVTVMVGTSAVVVRLMAPETYTDNLLAAAGFTAALLPIVSCLRERAGLAAALVLLAGGAIAHGPSFLVVALALGSVAFVLLPWSWRAWRGGRERLIDTPSARLAGLLIGAGAVSAAAVFGVLRAAPDTPKLSRGELTKKLDADVPLYRYWLTLPLAAIGAWSSWRAGRAAGGARRDDGESADEPRAEPWWRPAPRLLLILLVAWAVVVAGGVALYFLGHDSPAHRFLSFLLPLPILVAVGVLAIAAFVGSRFAGHARLAGSLVVLAGVLLIAGLGYRELYGTLAGADRGVEWIDPAKIQDAATAAAYLDAVGVPRDAAVVFVIDDQGPNPLSYVPEMTYMLRSALPADRLPHTYIYVGNPLKYLAGQPTYRARPKTYDANANRFWPTIQTLLPEHPVALVLASYDPLYRPVAAAHPDWVVAPNVIALVGPHPDTPVTAPPIPRAPATKLGGAALGVATIAIFGLIGLGWAYALLPRGVRSFEIVALAPAFGITLLVLGGVLVDGLGLRLTGFSGGLTPVLVGVAGGVAGVVTLRRRSAVSPVR